EALGPAARADRSLRARLQRAPAPPQPPANGLALAVARFAFGRRVVLLLARLYRRDRPAQLSGAAAAAAAGMGLADGAGGGAAVRRRTLHRRLRAARRPVAGRPGRDRAEQ